MTEEKRNGGALFKNDKKQKETQPDYTGTITVDGVDYWLSAWVKESKAGMKYFSLATTKKDSQPTTTTSSSSDDIDLPF